MSSIIKNIDFNKKINKFFIVLGVIILFAIIYTILCPSADHWKGLSEVDDKTLYDKFFNRLYFSIATMTTIGYGDLSPLSKTARFVALIQMFILILPLFVIF
jgi:hypothetical protein